MTGLIIQICAPFYRSTAFRLARASGWDLASGRSNPSSLVQTDADLFKDGIVQRRRNRRVRSIVMQTIRPSDIRRCDLVVVQGSPTFLNSWIIALARRALGKPVAFWGHHPQQRKTKFQQWIRQNYMRLPNIWVAYSHTEATRFEAEGYSAQAAPNPVTLDRASASSLGTDILILGRLNEEKQIPATITEIDRGVSKVMIHVVGNGPDLGSIQQCKDSLQSCSVQLHGHLDVRSDEFRSLIRRCGVILIPTYAGLNLLDALLMGIPVLVNSRSDHSPEIEAAWTFPEMIQWFDGLAALNEALQVALGANWPTQEGRLKVAEAVRTQYSAHNWLSGFEAAAHQTLDPLAKQGHPHCRSGSIDSQRSQSSER